MYFRVIEDGKDTDKLEQSFKSDFMKTLAHLQVNPFIYSTYSSNNLSHRAAFFHGLYIIEYQMIPVQLNTRKAVDEVILTSLVPAQSERYQEATAELECFEWNDEKLE